MGEEIGVRSLAKLSGRSHSTVAKWCADGGWTDQKDHHRIELRSKTQSKVLEANSSVIADRYTKLDQEHLKGFELFRKMSQQFAGILLADIQQESKGNSDRKKKITSPQFSQAMQRYSSIFADMARMERMVTGADYQLIDKAIASVTNAGFEVVNPSTEMLIEQLEAEGYVIQKKDEKAIAQAS